MDELLAIVIIFMLIYIIDILKKEKRSDKNFSYTEVLPQYKDKNCEIIVKKPMPSIEAMHSIKGILADWDEEWVMIYVKNKKTSSQKIIRADNIASIKEILQ